jgi:hypothetical protein
MVVAAIECLANDFFHQLTKKMDHTPVFYFSQWPYEIRPPGV